MLRRLLIGVAIVLPIAIAGLVIAQRRRAEPPPVFWSVPAFTLVDQDSAPFSSSELEGSVWLASFVYTNCPDVCPLVTQRMSIARDSLKSWNRLGDARLFSITVDPVRDTPGVLRAYAARFRAEKPDWLFLTGPLDTIIPLVNEGFKLTAMHPGRHDAFEHEDAHKHESVGADYLVNHSDRIVLIDRTGRVRGTYESSDPAAIVRMYRDLRTVLRE